MTPGVLVILAASTLVPNAATAQARPGPSAVPDWSGRWEGSLENFPSRPGAPIVKVIREIGHWPVKDGECATFRTRYVEGGQTRGVKDYKLCRGTGADDLFVDEGDVAEGKALRLPARWLGGVLIAPFKYGETLLLGLTRVDRGTMVEEIYTAADQPAQKDSVVPLSPRSVQRLTLKRRPK